ncbi:MAG: hypothetical protein H0W37_13135 [Pseudonocardiales bacterium]|nr:hypothetical protein [Pseudonocardiales bacterium]
MPEQRRVLSGIAAYTLWGLFPLYWPLLKPASPVEILAHRFVWSLVFLGILIAIRGNWTKMRAVFARSGRASVQVTDVVRDDGPQVFGVARPA